MSGHPEGMVAMTMLVIKDAELGSREVYSYFSCLDDAIVSALAMVEARGWVMYRHQREQFTVEEAERGKAYMIEHGYPDATRSVSAMTFLPEVDEDGTVWADSDQHMGAIYASELRTSVRAGK